MSNKTEFASVRDAKWLAENGYTNIDKQRFTDWVTRLFGDGVGEETARKWVINEILKEEKQ